MARITLARAHPHRTIARAIPAAAAYQPPPLSTINDILLYRFISAAARPGSFSISSWTTTACLPLRPPLEPWSPPRPRPFAPARPPLARPPPAASPAFLALPRARARATAIALALLALHCRCSRRFAAVITRLHTIIVALYATRIINARRINA